MPQCPPHWTAAVRAKLALDGCHSGAIMAPVDLNRYVESLRESLAIVARAGGDDAEELAERLTAPLDSAVRLVLLEALSAAADEITREIAPGAVEVRLRGGEPEFVATPPPTEEEFDEIGTGDGSQVTITESEDGGTARLNLRLPETLKERIERAAGAEGLSLNAWLVRTASEALSGRGRGGRPGPMGGDRYTGWVR